MKQVDIYEEDGDCSIVIDEDFDTTDFNFHPENKRFEVSQSIKNDCFYNNQIIEYKISADPVELWMRTLESSHEPPKEYSIRDGVVLESALKENSLFPDRIEKLKKEVEWAKVPIFGHPEVNLYILSKHPEIISKDDYRRFLRQSLERIKLGVSKVENIVKGDSNDLVKLKIESSEDGSSKGIWYVTDESEKEESDAYWKLSEEDRAKSLRGKKIKYVENFTEPLFAENSPKYVGITDWEFRNSKEITEHLEKLLDKKDIPVKKEEVTPQNNNQTNKTITVLIYLLTVFFIILKLTDSVDWSWFAVIAPVLIWEGFGFIIGFLRGLAK